MYLSALLASPRSSSAVDGMNSSSSLYLRRPFFNEDALVLATVEVPALAFRAGWRFLPGVLDGGLSDVGLEAEET